MKKILAIAQDANPSQGFTALSDFIQTKWSSQTMQLMLGKGKEFPCTNKQIQEAISDNDILLLGMSSSSRLSAPELFAGHEAVRLRKPVALFGDCDGCFNREWFLPLAHSVSLYFGVSPKDAERAKKVFPNATCYGYGNPNDEQMVFSRYSREKIREKLGVSSSESLVLASGSKTVSENCLMWAVLIDTLSVLAKQGKKVKLFLAIHPGDRSFGASDRTKEAGLLLYEELVDRAPFPVVILTKDICSSSDAVVGADLVVSFGGSIARESAFKQIPVVGFGFETAYQRMLKETGNRIPEMITFGIAKLVTGSRAKRAGLINQLLTSDNPLRVQLLKNQKRICVPPPHQGYAVEMIYEALTGL